MAVSAHRLAQLIALAAVILPVASPLMARDIARSCIVGDAVAGPLLERRLREGTGQTGCDPQEARIVFRIEAGAGPGFRIGHAGADIVIAADTTLGLVHGAGWILRHVALAEGRADIAIPRERRESPRLSVRMTQIGYRPKNNSLDGWTTGMFERRLEDMALWGASGVQVIAPVSDDAPTSPLFPQTPIETLQAIGHTAHRLGMQFALYYPMLGDYPDAAAIAAEVATLDSLLADLPLVDGLYVPGGDPGHTPPTRLFPLMEEAALAAKRHNPKVDIWLSTQGFDAGGLEAFYRELAEQPDWLTGIFAGPQTRDPVWLQRQRIPGRYRLLLYPDIAHTMHAQFPVPQWWPEFALTQGREPINPQPSRQVAIARHFAGLYDGFVTYSEGVADDFNQLLWYRLGWDPASADKAPLDYARMFIGDPQAAELIGMLERNWIGDPAANDGIAAALTMAEALQPGPHADWRWDSLLYRATYDALVRQRTVAARERQRAAIASLRAPGPAHARAAAARAALARPDGDRIERLHAQLETLAQRLFDEARLQLSVPRFGASHVERGANLDRARVDLNDRVWLEREIATALALPDEKSRRAALSRIADISRSAEGALYDDLGNPGAQPHLVRGDGPAGDPQMFRTAVDGIADMIPEDGWRMAELTYAEALYDAPLRLRYWGLEPGRDYALAVTYAGESYSLPMRLVANGHVVHDARIRQSNPERATFTIPGHVIVDWSLELRWTRPEGMGGSGRGAQVAETWLVALPRM